MKYHGKESGAPYPIYSTKIGSIGELIDLEYPSKYFVLLLAADFTIIENEKLIKIAKKLIDKGLAYICTWGPGCSNAHDTFDLSSSIWGEENHKEFHVPSTWHDDQPLEEALWFCIFCAMVDEEFWDECSTIAVTINDKGWAEIIEDSLADVSAFSDKMVNE